MERKKNLWESQGILLFTPLQINLDLTESGAYVSTFKLRAQLRIHIKLNLEPNHPLEVQVL